MRDYWLLEYLHFKDFIVLCMRVENANVSAVAAKNFRRCLPLLVSNTFFCGPSTSSIAVLMGKYVAL